MYSLLPPNTTPLERAVSGACQISVLPVPIKNLWSAERCPVAALPWLAWALSVDEWDGSWDEPTQRAVIAASIEIHRHKGTVAAVRRAINAAGRFATLFEWWQQAPTGVPHTFRAEVEIEDRGVTAAEVASIERLINAAKPARSHYSLRLIGRTTAAAMVGIGGQDLVTTTVYPQ